MKLTYKSAMRVAATILAIITGLSRAHASLTVDAYLQVGIGASTLVGSGAITVDGNSEGNFYLGEITLAGSIKGGAATTFSTVCTDVGGVVYVGSKYYFSDQNYNNTITGLNPQWGNPIDPSNASQAIQNAADTFFTYSGSSTYNGYTRTQWWEAIQLAVWEELYDTPNTSGGGFDLSSGRFKVDGSVVGTTVFNLAESFLGQAGQTYSGDILVPLKNVNTTASTGDPDSTKQEMLYNVTPAPEPTTLVAGMLLLLPFGASTMRFLRRRRVA